MPGFLAWFCMLDVINRTDDFLFRGRHKPQPQLAEPVLASIGVWQVLGFNNHNLQVHQKILIFLARLARHSPKPLQGIGVLRCELLLFEAVAKRFQFSVSTSLVCPNRKHLGFGPLKDIGRRIMQKPFLLTG
jgi:hypothetical protein